MSRDRTESYLRATNTFGYNKCREVGLRVGKIENRLDTQTGIHICYNPKCRSLLYTKKYTCNFCNCAFYCTIECSRYANFRTCLFCYIADLGDELLKDEDYKLPNMSPKRSSL